MIWFIITALLIVAIPVLYKLNKKFDKYDMSFCMLVGVIAVAVACCTIGIFFNNRGLTKDSYIELQEIYQGLNYKAEKLNKGLSDEFGLNNNDIINEITDYNKAVRTLQRQNKSLWLNWYIVDDVDNLQLIDYTKFNFNGE